MCVAGGVAGGVVGGGVVAGVVVAGGVVADDVPGSDARGEPDDDAPPRRVAVVPGDELLVDCEAWPFGEGVRVPDCAPGDDEFVGGVGVKIDGTDELVPVQADTATATRTTPAAVRPKVSHAPWAPPGVVRRIFMNPPRMRVR